MKRILHALAGAAGWALGLAADVLFGPRGGEYVSRTNGPIALSREGLRPR